MRGRWSKQYIGLVLLFAVLAIFCFVYIAFYGKPLAILYGFASWSGGVLFYHLFINDGRDRSADGPSAIR